MNAKTAQIIADFVERKLDEAPLAEQLQVYEALAKSLPTKGQRASATSIAKSLRLLLVMRQSFKQQLIRELQWPGHRHDGDGHGKH